jgi:hypothetical protein
MRRDAGRLDREGVASMMRTIFALLFFAVSTLAHAETLTLHSTYDCSGTNPDGSKYTGTATVKVISEATFTVRWKIGDATYQGFGMRNGDTLAATYTLDGEPGLIIYKVGDDGTLKGVWVVRGKDDVGTERLTPSD